MDQKEQQKKGSTEKRMKLDDVSFKEEEVANPNKRVR